MKKGIYILSLILLVVGCKTQKQTAVVEAEKPSERFMYYFYEAQRCLSQQQYDKGMALLLFCEQLCPDDAATQQALGYMCQATAQPEKALKHYARAFNGDKQIYWSAYASLLFELGEKQKAAEVLEEAVRLSPRETDALEALSTVYAAMQNNKKALQVQDRIEAIEGINAYNTLTRYRLLLAEGKTDKAVQAIDRYLQENPDDLRFRVFRADLYLTQGKEREAVELYKEELRKNPDNPYVFLSMAGYAESKGDTKQAAEYTQRAVLSDEWGMPQKLQTLRDYASRLDKVEGMTEQTLICFTHDYPIEEAPHASLAQYYISHSRYREARPVLHTMLDINPDNAATWQTMLQVLQADTTTDDSEYEDIIRRAYGRMSDNPQWAYWMARLLVNKHENDSALQIARFGAEKPGDARYRLGLRILEGDICSLLGDIPAMYDAYEKALAIDPNNIYVLNNYAYMLAIHGGDLRQAEQMSRKTIEAEPANATYLDTYAWIMHLQQQEFFAKYYIQKAVENMNDREAEEIREHYRVIMGEKTTTEE